MCSCLSLLQQGNETMADRLLVLVPHEHTPVPRSILEQARKVGPDVTEMRAIKHTVELIAHSLCIANGLQASIAKLRERERKMDSLRPFSQPGLSGRDCVHV